MNAKQIERLLLSGVLDAPGLDAESSPTPECLPMPLLVDIAAGRKPRAAEQRKHVYACGFCRGLVDKLQRRSQTFRMVRLGSLCSLAAAACLVLGLFLGNAWPGHTTPAGIPAAKRQARLASYDRLQDLANRAEVEPRDAESAENELLKELIRVVREEVGVCRDNE